MKALPWIRIIALLFSLMLVACAEDISSKSDDSEVSGDNTSPDDSDEPPVATEPGPGGEQLGFSNGANDTFIADVDASGTAWVYVNLVTQEQVNPADPANSDEWHIAHLGAQIKLNGGVSGSPSSGVSTAIYADKVAAGESYPFDSIVGAPPEGSVDYHTDTIGDHDGNPLTPDEEMFAMSHYPEADSTSLPLVGNVLGNGDHGWYTSKLFGTDISQRDNVAYVLRTHECRYFKLRMLGYQNGDGDDGFPSYQFVEIAGGSCSADDNQSIGDSDAADLGLAEFSTSNGVTSITADAGSEDDWVYLDLTGMRQVKPNTPTNDPYGWDIALQRSYIKMNSGVSGTGTVGLHDIFEGDWETLSSEPADAEYHVDVDGEYGGAFQTYPAATVEPDGPCGPGNGDYGWYYYSSFCSEGGGFHRIIPRDVVYVLKGQDQALWKLRILDYYGGDGSSGNFVIEISPIGG